MQIATSLSIYARRNCRSIRGRNANGISGKSGHQSWKRHTVGDSTPSRLFSPVCATSHEPQLAEHAAEMSESGHEPFSPEGKQERGIPMIGRRNENQVVSVCRSVSNEAETAANAPAHTELPDLSQDGGAEATRRLNRAGSERQKIRLILLSGPWKKGTSLELIQSMAPLSC